MAKSKEGSGLMSSAGLMRYYDAEETAVQIHPKTVVMVALAADWFPGIERLLWNLADCP